MRRYYYHKWEMILYQFDYDKLEICWDNFHTKRNVQKVYRGYNPTSWETAWIVDLPSFIKFYKRLINKRRKSMYKDKADSYEAQKGILTDCFEDVVLHRNI